jgi:pimeloyl-ACP methyl ester carboxylesterase
VGFVSSGLSAEWVEHKLVQNRLSVSPECRAGYLDMFWNADFADEARGRLTPVLAVVGDRDPGLDEALMRETFLHWHPNSELQVIPNCGHYPMQECPPFLAGVMERFLLRHAASPTAGVPEP